MKSIFMQATYGDEVKNVTIMHNELGSGGYQILINNYNQGYVFCENGEWHGRINAKSELTMDDIQILGEIIEKNGTFT